MRRISAFTTLWRTLRGQRRPDAPGVSEQLAAVPRMVMMTLRGEYHGVDRSRLLLMAAALAYVVSPVDLVPEGLLLVVGIGDDAFVLSWLAGAVLADTEAFLSWEHETSREGHSDQRQGRTVPGEAY